MANVYLWLTALVSLFTKQDQAPAEDVSTPMASPNLKPHDPSSVISIPQQSGMAKKPLSRIMPPRKEKAADVAITMPIEEPSSSTHGETSISPTSKGVPVIIPIQEVRKRKYEEMINKMVGNLREHELGKLAFGCAIPLTGFLILFANSIFAPLLRVIAIALCTGFVCLWNGILLRGAIPDKWAIRLEIFGVVCVMFAFFSVVGSFFPPEIAWIVWGCFLLCLLPLALSFCHVKETAPTDGKTPI